MLNKALNNARTDVPVGDNQLYHYFDALHILPDKLRPGLRQNAFVASEQIKENPLLTKMNIYLYSHYK